MGWRWRWAEGCPLWSGRVESAWGLYVVSLVVLEGGQVAALLDSQTQRSNA